VAGKRQLGAQDLRLPGYNLDAIQIAFKRRKRFLLNIKQRQKYASELGKRSWKARKMNPKTLEHLREIASQGGEIGKIQIVEK